MQKQIRTFVALKIQAEKEILNQLEYFKQIFKNDKIKWVNTNDFHLTLRFIGNTTREELYNLVDQLKYIGESNHPFQLEIKGAGYFNAKDKPRVLFVNICDSEPLFSLVKDVEKAVVACGFHQELKPFCPHLTLGRIKHLESRTRFCSIVDDLRNVKYQNVKVAEFVLYQSILKTEGPIYKPIKVFKLK